MAEAVEKVPFLEGRREWLLFSLAALILLTMHLTWLYREYRTFVSRPFYYSWGTVLESRTKGSDRGPYRVLKVRTEEGVTLWTRTWRREDLTGRRVRLQLRPSERIGFADYLRGPYVPSRIKAVGEPEDSASARLGRAIALQHDDPEAAAFYRSIFLADPLPPELRERIAVLGVSHLVALSGFHLGILWGGIFLLLRPLYRFFQLRYFPWRYDLLDFGGLALVLLAGYLWLTGAPPSLLRAYVMLAAGWGAVLLGVEIVGFPFLLVTAVVLAVLFPPLLLSWSFWLSLTGVFAIFLILKHFGNLSPRLLAFLVIPLGVYWLMLPVSHTLFGVVSPWQNLSPLLSVLFVPFYPTAMLLHLTGYGGVMDGILEWLWTLPGRPAAMETLPEWFLALYGGCALMAMRHRHCFRILMLGSAGIFVYLYL